MNQKRKHSSRQPTAFLNKKRREATQPSEATSESLRSRSPQPSPSPRCVGFPPELFLKIIPCLDPHSLMKLALSCRWLFHEISNRKRLWKGFYCQDFSFDSDARELKWLQQIRIQQQRSLRSSTG